MNKIKLSIIISVVVLAVISYSLWFTYESPYPKWWNDVKSGDSYGMWESKFNDDAVRGYDWSGKWNKMGGYYINRSEWIRTEYFAQATMDKTNISKWEIKKFQYSAGYIFHKIYKESIDVISGGVFKLRKIIFDY